MNTQTAFLGALLVALAAAGTAAAASKTLGAGDAYVHASAGIEHHYAYDCLVVDAEVYEETNGQPGLQRSGPNPDRQVGGDEIQDSCFV